MAQSKGTAHSKGTGHSKGTAPKGTPASAEPEARSLGFWTCTALVIGNVVGSGFFLIPAALAPYGAVALIGWVAMSFGAVALALVFARLSRIAPAAGGPYAFTRLGFGEFAGFLIAWGYWISIWASQPAIALAFAGYLESLIPGLQGMKGATTIIALASMWFVAAINLRGVKEAGRFQLAMVAIKIVPFLAIATIGLLWVDWNRFVPINPTGQSFWAALSATAPLTMFAFLGIESATVPAGDVKDPERTIPRATIVGTLVAACLFLFGTMAVMGVVPEATLAASSAPFSAAATSMWGGGAGVIIALAAMLSSLGALNGWTLLMAQVPMAAARDGVLPRFFGETNRNGVPTKGILLSVSLSSALLILESSGVKGLMKVYDFIVDISTDAEMVPYVFCCCVEGILFATLAKREGLFSRRTYIPIATVAFLFSMWTIYGSGPRAGMWGLLLLLAGLPLYVHMRRSRPDSQSAEP